MSVSVTFRNIYKNSEDLRKEYTDALSRLKEPVFESYIEDLEQLNAALEPYKEYQYILLVGNGGSIWSFMPFYTALVDRINGKTVIPVTDMEPDNLALIKAKYPVSSTLVLVVSKSGSTVGVIENLFALSDYKQLYVTDPNGTIGKIGAHNNVDVIPHPPVGGRYSSFTSCAYTPGILAGLPVREIEAGAREGYKQYRNTEASDNPALQTALLLYYLENNNYTEMFVPIYSNFLQTFGMIITQLFHESFGKDSKGLTVLAAQAPESQHHTNQRFFGGRKNMVGCFIHVTNQKNEVTIDIPAELQKLPLRDGQLSDINGISLAKSFESEYLGTYTDADNQGIPLIDVAVSEINGQTMGQLMAFWHYVTVYSAILREVDPYDQPQVESSKVISFERRKEAR